MLPIAEMTREYLRSLDIPVIKSSSKRSKNKIDYLNIEAGFDIETSSVYVFGEKAAHMYIWMLGIGHGQPVFYGRTWSEFTDALDMIQDELELNHDRRMIIYVHNLGYEFQFMKDILKWDSIFATKERRPLKAICDMGIEFRCSYRLSSMSLATVARNLVSHKLKKKTGDLDYSLIRHHETPLTDAEMGYCESDVEVLTAYINEQIAEHDNNITKIPLTNTGRVRTYVREKCYNDEYGIKYRKRMKKLQLRYVEDEDGNVVTDDYEFCRAAFCGGFTHPSPEYVQVLLDDVDSIDFASCYPAVMLTEKYPMTEARDVDINTVEDLKELQRNNCVIFGVTFKGLRNKIKVESYLSESKCVINGKRDIVAGRIFNADEVGTVTTCVDFLVIEACYEWDSITFGKAIAFGAAYLPKPIIESILDFYAMKTELKGVAGKEVEYMRGKNMLNSIYGMCVTKIENDEYDYTGVWTKELADRSKAIQKYNKSPTRFLFYPWGVFVTAYARRNLWTGIIQFGNDYVYSDTDSIKAKNYSDHLEYVNGFNAAIEEKLNLMAKFHNINPERFAPKTKDGKRKLIGIWEHEGKYDQFKTLGPKRYMTVTNGEAEITVAGVPKQKGIDYIAKMGDNDINKMFAVFDDGLTIPGEDSGKQTSGYVDDPKEYEITDYLGNDAYIETPSGLHLEAQQYELSIAPGFLDFIERYLNGEIELFGDN